MNLSCFNGLLSQLGKSVGNKFRELEGEAHNLAKHDALRHSLDLMRILEANHPAEEEKITLRQLVLTRQGLGESVVNYIDRWLEIAYKGEDPSPRNMWIRLCLHSLHHDFRILAIGEYFKNFEELALFMETVEDHVLFL